MNCDELIAETGRASLYNLHCHTQFCDGRAPMRQFVEAALNEEFRLLGFSPHSPIPIESPCNMAITHVYTYINEFRQLKTEYASTPLQLLSGMEVDYLGDHWGAHIPYFQSLPLDYLISSVHFIPNQEGEPVDIDGRFEAFRQKMLTKFHGDIRYVVDRFFGQTIQMLEHGGFHIAGHFDKIALNSSLYSPGIEDTDWFKRQIDNVIDALSAHNYIVEINTKHFERYGRFFPNPRYWSALLQRHIPLIISTDAHEPGLLSASRQTALQLLTSI